MLPEASLCRRLPRPGAHRGVSRSLRVLWKWDPRSIRTDAPILPQRRGQPSRKLKPKGIPLRRRTGCSKLNLPVVKKGCRVTGEGGLVAPGLRRSRTGALFAAHDGEAALGYRKPSRFRVAECPRTGDNCRQTVRSYSSRPRAPVPGPCSPHRLCLEKLPSLRANQKNPTSGCDNVGGSRKPPPRPPT